MIITVKHNNSITNGIKLSDCIERFAFRAGLSFNESNDSSNLKFRATDRKQVMSFKKRLKRSKYKSHIKEVILSEEKIL